nr:GNAT family N-acetyltransferase [uncultured Desulfobacter sp.]
MHKEFKRFDLYNHKDEWKKYIQMLPEENQDIYFEPGYYQIYQDAGYGVAECVVYSEDNKFIIYPFLRRTLKNIAFDHPYSDYSDIEGAYGINGAGTNVKNIRDERQFFENFSSEFTEFCLKNKILAEFTRFNSLLENHHYFFHTSILKQNQSIIVNLACENLMIDSYAHAVRKNIKKAERNELSWQVVEGTHTTSEQLDQFMVIYERTMDRNNASDFFYFEKSYFEKLNRELQDKALYFFIFKEDICVSTELVLKGAQTAYSFLGGTDADYYALGSNSFLKHKIHLHLKAIGVKYFYLGGGTTDNDGIFNYKKRFAKNGVIDFFIGKRIFFNEEYDNLISQWEQLNPGKKDKYKNFLTRYRL